jgi:protein translocase SecG subunit
LFIVVCILLIVVVLLQKGRGGGLGGALGGGGMGTSAFGTRTGDVFTWVTIVLTGLFLLLAIITTVVFRPPADAILPPSFDNSGMPITDEKKVSINIPASKGGDVKVYFTLDGSDPTDKSEEYKRIPVVVQPGQVLKAIGIRGTRSSNIAVASFPRAETTTEPASKPASRPAARTGGTSTSAPSGPETTKPAPGRPDTPPTSMPEPNTAR